MLKQLFEIMGGLLKPSDVSQVLAEHDCRERRRGGKLPPETTFWLVIQLVLNRGMSIRSLLAELGLEFGLWAGKPPHSTSVAKARDRLGWRVFRECLRRLRPENHVQDQWRGKTVLAVDGTCFRAPNSAANVAALGKPTTSKRTANWPLLRCVLAIGIRSHWVYDAAFAPYRKWRSDMPVGEAPLSVHMAGRMGKDTLLFLDRAYCLFSTLRNFLEEDLDFVVRARKSSKGFKPRAFERLKDKTDLVLVRRKTTGESLVLRRIRFRYKTRRKLTKKIRKGAPYERNRKLKTWTHVTLLTSLLDPERYPSSEIKELYRQRWEVEHVFKELKTQIGGGEVQFRGQTLTRVLQEAYATLIAFNGIRSVASAAAARARVAQVRVSFSLVLTLVRVSTKRTVVSRSAIVSWAAEDGVLPERRDRHYARTVLARTPKYPVRKPRRLAA